MLSFETSASYAYEAPTSTSTIAESLIEGTHTSWRERVYSASLLGFDPRVDSRYLRNYGGGRRVAEGIYTIPDGHVSFRADEIEARWQEDMLKAAQPLHSNIKPPVC
jgi:hypothetical protein